MRGSLAVGAACEALSDQHNGRSNGGTDVGVQIGNMDIGISLGLDVPCYRPEVLKCRKTIGLMEVSPHTRGTR